MGKFLLGRVWIVAAICLAPAHNAVAGDCLVPQVLGPVLNNNCARPTGAKTRAPTAAAVSDPAKADQPKPQADYTGLDVQKALNFFGMRAGHEDGIVGRRTRFAINRMQNAIGTNRTGVLTDEERQFLVETYRRAFANGRKGNRNMLVRLWQKRS